MNNNMQMPADASAALYFLPGQYLFADLKESSVSLKALSSDQVARAFRKVHTDTGWLGKRVLRYREAPEGNAILSYEPAAIRKIIVVFHEKGLVELSVPLPPLILLGRGREYYLWAAPSSHISANTGLAVAPLPNISSGKICFGKNEVPETHPSTLSEVWKLIFDTPFNADHASERCLSEPHDVRELLWKLAADKGKKFPKSELLLSSTTIDDAWETIVEQRRYDLRF
ncbi:MAG: hypothetical protein IPM50_03005 [Acidobacteriota bacterium]|nr:MAG: hypothetical protein IPM50_03005 [Acidobacteriota bacterium]